MRSLASSSCPRASTGQARPARRRSRWTTSPTPSAPHNDDPLILDPRVKLGHDDPRFNSAAELAHMWDPTWDGEPAFGRAVNLRLTEDGAVIVADLEGLPTG
jgi:hypothetical protein